MIGIAEMSRRVQVRSLGAARPGEIALDITIESEPGELAALARRLDVPAVSRVQCRFLLSGAEKEGRIAADGTLSAGLTRICVATLEAFDSEIAERFQVRFVPQAALDAEPDDALDLEADDDLPYHGMAIDLGEAAIEQLALAMDPYPRKPGAELPPGIGSIDVPDVAPDLDQPDDPDFSMPDRPNPFAVLAHRRRTDN